MYVYQNSFYYLKSDIFVMIELHNSNDPTCHHLLPALRRTFEHDVLVVLSPSLSISCVLESCTTGSVTRRLLLRSYVLMFGRTEDDSIAASP